MDRTALQNLIKEVETLAQDAQAKTGPRESAEVKQQLQQVTDELVYELKSLPENRLVYRQLHSDCRVFVPLAYKPAFPFRTADVIRDAVVRNARHPT